MLKYSWLLLAGAVSFAVFAAAPAVAQTAGDPVTACREAHGGDANARIACLELAIERMGAASASAPSQTPRQVEAAQPSRPSWSIRGFRASQQAQQEGSVRVQIVRIRYGRDGLGFFTTADGQVWRETVEAPERRHLDPEETYEAVIDRGVIGGFRMNVDGIRWEYKVEPLN